MTDSRTARTPTPPRGPKGTRGAVMVEFLIAFLPMFCFFLCLVQFMMLQVGSILVKHAAEVTARAAVVVLHDDPQYYGGVPVGSVTGKRKQDIEKAANMVLAPLYVEPGATIDAIAKPGDPSGGLLTVKMNGSYGRDEMVEVKLEFYYPCAVPFGRYIACVDTIPQGSIGEASMWKNGVAEHRLLTGTASLPNQGADYTY